MTAQDMALLRDLAAGPRPTGSEAIARARERCTRELRALGLTVREQPFEYAAFVGRFAFPVFGADAAILALAVVALATAGLRFTPVITAIVGGTVMVLVGRWFLRDAILDAPLLRSTGVNLEARLEDDTPSIWLCAHIDTKSQPIPTLVRTIGLVLESGGVFGILVLAAALGCGVAIPSAAWTVMAALTLAGAVPVVLCVVGANSAGALDNASGVVTVLAAAREMRGVRGVGVLITDAEELALAGARAWSHAMPEGGRGGQVTVLNCDGIDDDGTMYVMHAGRRPQGAIEAAERASRSTGIAYRARRLGLGILTDSVAFADAGIASLSFSRGSMRSLARVHSPRDNLDNLRGSGIAEAATFVAATARELHTGQV